MNRGKSGISPVMATVILVAIAIVIAIAVAFWATGLVGVFTRFEKLEITSAYYVSGTGVVLTVRNTGSADTSIDNIFVNGMPCVTDEEGEEKNPCNIDSEAEGLKNPLTVAIGDTRQITVGKPPSGGDWAHGVTYEIVVHTSSGKSYPVAVLIP
ncbi:MAG: archaellin/type IV pilin N-terminal domain-containing protein [Nitrososphaerota archaeon]